LQFGGLSGERIQNAAACFQLANLRFDLGGIALQEKLLEDFGGLVFRRNRDRLRARVFTASVSDGNRV
jgi:hypothetical protein